MDEKRNQIHICTYIYVNIYIHIYACLYICICTRLCCMGARAANNLYTGIYNLCTYAYLFKFANTFFLMTIVIILYKCTENISTLIFICFFFYITFLPTLSYIYMCVCVCTHLYKYILTYACRYANLNLSNCCSSYSSHNILFVSI